MTTPLTLMQIHVETLFTYDENQRLLTVNEPEGAAAPRVFLGKTEGGIVCRFRSDLPEAIVTKLKIFLKKESVVDQKLLTEVLGLHKTIQRIWSGPAYEIPVNDKVETNAITITQENTALLHDRFDWLIPIINLEQPCLGVVVDGRVVSICRSVRIGSQAHEAGVETVIGYRGRGLAAAAVRGWATAVHRLGFIPLYSTSWENKASQRVAKKLEMLLYGATFHIT